MMCCLPLAIPTEIGAPLLTHTPNTDEVEADITCAGDNDSIIKNNI